MDSKILFRNNLLDTPIHGVITDNIQEMMQLYKRIQRKEKAKERMMKLEKMRLERLENLD
jgi:hypothetical protein